VSTAPIQRTAGEPPKHRKGRKPRQPWDVYRKVAVWAALLLPIAVLLYGPITGAPMFTGDATEGDSALTVCFLVYPALVSGAATGSRFFALYAGYAARNAPTDELTDDQRRAGYAAAISGPIGDWLWSSLIAAVTGAALIIAYVAPGQAASSGDGALYAVAFGALLYLPIAFTVAMGWALGAIIGTGVSVFLSAVLGILFGLRHRAANERRGTFTWVMIAVWLGLALIVAIGAAGVRGYTAFYLNAAPFAYLAGFSAPGLSYEFGPVVLVVSRVAIWLGAVLFLVLIAVGTPHLLKRLEDARRRRAG